MKVHGTVGIAYHSADTEQVSWQGMFSVIKSRKRRQFTKTTGFDEEIHSAETLEHNNRLQAIAVRNEDCVDDATTNMDNGKNISHRNLMMNSKHPSPKKIHTLQKELLRNRGQSEYVEKGKDCGSESL